MILGVKRDTFFFSLFLLVFKINCFIVFIILGFTRTVFLSFLFLWCYGSLWAHYLPYKAKQIMITGVKCVGQSDLPFLVVSLWSRGWSGVAVWGTSPCSTSLVWSSVQAPSQPVLDSASHCYSAHPHMPGSTARPAATIIIIIIIIIIHTYNKHTYILSYTQAWIQPSFINYEFYMMFATTK